MNPFKKLCSLLKPALNPSVDPALELAMRKRAREAQLKAAGVSCSQAKRQVYREFEGRKA